MDLSKAYSVAEALVMASSTATVKFDSSVEVHVKVNIDAKQSEQQIRTVVNLPHGTGKKKVIAAFVSSGKEAAAKEAGADLAGGDELVQQIKKTEKIEFDIAVAEPAMMKNLAPIAKILGTKGKMPSPKTGTVTADISKAIKDIRGGKVDVKNDETGNIHQIIGKASFDSKKLEENFQAFIQAVRAAKPKGSKQEYISSVTISTSMGPGIRVSA